MAYHNLGVELEHLKRVQLFSPNNLLMPIL